MRGFALYKSVLLALGVTISVLLTRPSLPQIQTNDNKKLGFQEKLSFDQSPKEYVVGSVRYRVPQNYVSSIEQSGSRPIATISMGGLLPSLEPVSRATLHCFRDPKSECARNVVTFGITRGTAPPAERILENLKTLLNQEKKSNECGLEYYSDLIPTEKTKTGFNYFLGSRASGEIIVLRCPKENAENTSHCIGTENIEGGNSVYYAFHHGHLCEWKNIRREILGNITKFKVGEVK